MLRIKTTPATPAPRGLVAEWKMIDPAYVLRLERKVEELNAKSERLLGRRIWVITAE
jgi:hypothetical protein